MFGGVAGILAGVGYLAPLMGVLTPTAVVIALLLGLSVAVGAALMRANGPRHLLLTLPFSLMAAVIVAVSIPLVKDGYADVRITATGQRNPASKSSEVFVRLISGSVLGLRDFEGDGWEKRGDVFVSYQNQPNVLLYRGAWGSPAALRFVRHPYSGIVEANIGGETHRIDLFAEREAYVDVPLPEATISWKGYLQRGSVIAGLTVLFAGVGLSFTSAGLFAGVVYFAAVLTSCLVLGAVRNDSYSGSAEFVAFMAEEAPGRVEMDAGYGFTPALVLPVKSGASKISSFEFANPLEWKIGIDGGSLRAFRDLDGSSDAPVSGSDNGCAIRSPGRCVYEVLGTDAKIWLQHGGEQRSVALPATVEGGTRLFLLVERESGRMTVSTSRAFVLLTPWDQFSRRIQAVRIIDADDAPAAKLVRLMSDGVGGYRMTPRRADGAFSVPHLDRPDTASYAGVKVMAVLMALSFVVLIGVAWRVVADLLKSYRAGRRVEVAAVLAASLFWVGAALAAGWPAVVGWDGFSPYIQVETGSVTLWYGIGYPLIVGGFLLLGSGAVITAWSAGLTLVVLLGAAAGVMRYCERTTRLVVAALFVVVPPLTAMGIGMLTHLRDAMNGLLLAVFAIGCFATALDWPALSQERRRLSAAGLLALGLMLALLRIDNLPTALFIASALIWVVVANRRQRVGLMLLVWVALLGVGPVVERLVIPDRIAAETEKRSYEATALINPLVGVLVRGRGQMDDAERAELRAILDKVMDISVAEKQWTPYNIIYWHETASLRPVPDRDVIRALRAIFVKTAVTHPVLFFEMRLATFVGTLGHTWETPEGGAKSALNHGLGGFHDHLQTDSPQWKRTAEIYGFAPDAHLSSHAAKMLQEWSSSTASTVLPLLLCLAIALRIRRHPCASIIAIGELMRAAVFFLLAPASVFLYLFDLHILGFLLPLLAGTEVAARRRRNSLEGSH